MSHCIDTNVLSALLSAEPNAHRISSALNVLRAAGPLIIHGSVYAELLAAPGNTPNHLDGFLKRGQIQVDWDTGESIWQASGRAYSAYAKRRSKSGGGKPRRILADFLIGAHALSLGAGLVTLDETHYRSAYPNLPLVLP
ncbi:type II toxin-antitoxin system VapC family toxin [Deinococcus detaillensis]|uniref:Type II toxin-antitoxin system VapC family toxin n=1 Tax=Deinococcus detaillensis TaxID=2592048 RepID=A0A553UZ39_9DEIO|nr:type II toxin-antitoxin system VapC family toxin [Deinococcus detaillensis]TSA85486.1 type II toxin-antitoxin system VapC family toxin [Deinococcus detaillensis]